MDLVPLSSVDRSTLRWLRTRDSPAEFALSSGDASVATLSWARSGGSLASARTAESTWTLKRAGFLAPTILVRAGDPPAVVARLSAHFRHHEIVLSDGTTYRLRRAGYIVPAWKLVSATGAERVHVEPVADGRKLAGGAVVVSEGEPRTDLLLLLVLVWHFIVLSWFEDEAIETLAPFEGPDAPLEVARRT